MPSWLLPSSHTARCWCAAQDASGTSISCGAVEQMTLVQLALLCLGTDNCVAFTLYTDQTQGYLKVPLVPVVHAACT